MIRGTKPMSGMRKKFEDLADFRISAGLPNYQVTIIDDSGKESAPKLVSAADLFRLITTGLREGKNKA